MLLSELLRPDLIKTDLDAENKHEAIGELVDLLVQQHDITMMQRGVVLDAILENEARAGSGMEEGIAVPHGHTDKVEDLICAMGISRKGVNFESLDGKPARIVALLIAPKRNFALEVRTLAGIQHLLEHAGLKEKLLEAADGAAAYKIIEAEEKV